MKPERFKELVNEQFTLCCDLLRVKEIDYSDGVDRLIQFKTAAGLRQTTAIDALAGMMVKHTTKLYQMITDTLSGVVFSQHQWDETLSDSINYLFLLRAVVEDCEDTVNDNK